MYAIYFSENLVPTRYQSNFDSASILDKLTTTKYIIGAIDQEKDLYL